MANKQLKTLSLNKEETELINLWKRILKLAKKTKNYNKKFSYGVYQIATELNTYTSIKVSGKEVKQPDYPELNGDLNSLKEMLSQYYDKYIKEKLFKYELIK